MQTEFDFELPTSGGLPRMSDFFEADTPRPGAVVASFKVESPKKFRRTSSKKCDRTMYHFGTSPQIGNCIKTLHDNVQKGTDISADGFRLLSSAMIKNFITMTIGQRQTLMEHRNSIDKLESELLEIQKNIATSRDSQEIEALKIQQKEKQNFLAALMTVGSKKKVVPHHARIHPASIKMFRDVLNPTSDRVYVSTNALMKQVSDDICEFLTSPSKLENRRRVVQQILDSKPK